MKVYSTVVMAVVLSTIAMIGTAGAATIFYDNFDGGAAASLNGTTPDITAGAAAWVASSDFKAGGYTKATNGGSATLAFTPVNGKIYTLDCTLSGVAGNGNWFAFGFAKGQTVDKGTTCRFTDTSVIGKAWMFIRGDASANANNCFLGDSGKGDKSGAPWSTYPNQSGGAMLMRIVLDTTGGSGLWTATWYAKKPADADYILVRTTAILLNEAINTVGFAVSNPTVEGTIESFSLNDNSIPPIAWSDETTSAITTNSALPSSMVSTNLTETVLVWHSLDQGTASTNDWSFQRSLGAAAPGVVSGQITNLTADTRYIWRLYGINSLGEGWSRPTSFVTSLSDAQRPVFTGAAALSPNIIQLNWQDNAATETGYVLQRSTSESSGFTTIAVLGADTTSYRDFVGLAESTVYYYQLAATNTANSSGTDFVICTTNALTDSFTGQGALRRPYRVDANTLHLWHLDEAAPGPAQPAPGVTGSFNLIPTNGATMGIASYAGLGSAGDTSADKTSGFQGSSISVSSVTGADGAFTFEALISVVDITGFQQIIAMDNNNANSQRPFQFRIDADTGSGSPATGALRFINIAGPIGLQAIIAPIPTAGDHAFVPGQWFQAAVTYNGSENTPDNMKFYWTRVDAQPYQANEIYSGTMTNDLAGVATVLGVGNEYRGPSDNNIKGQIDEVRISNIARAPDRMMFYKIPGTMILIR